MRSGGRDGWRGVAGGWAAGGNFFPFFLQTGFVSKIFTLQIGQKLYYSWRRWKRDMEYYLAATCTDKTEAQKVAIFMCMIGKDGQEVKDTFEFDTRENGREVITTAILFNKFEAHCKPKKNLVVERHRFLTREQLPGESVDQYVTELRTLAASCEWDDLKDDLICGRIVSGISSRVVRERLLRESDLKLNNLLKFAEQTNYRDIK